MSVVNSRRFGDYTHIAEAIEPSNGIEQSALRHSVVNDKGKVLIDLVIFNNGDYMEPLDQPKRLT